MQIEFDNFSGCLLIKLAGEIDHHTSDNIRQVVDRNIKKLQATNLVFDFKDVSFMDSSGIGVLLGRYKRIKELGGKMTIVRAQTQVNKILEMSGVNQLLASEPSCLDHFGKD